MERACGCETRFAVGGAAWGIAGALLVAALTGCGKSDLVQVKGKVLLDGQPVEGAVVLFHPSASVTRGNGGRAYSDSNGAFQATTPQGRKGLFPGDYAITLSGKKRPAGVNPRPETPEELQAHVAALRAAPDMFPVQYADKASTPLTVTVEPGLKPLELLINSREP
jgi:hypothetical protein